MKHPKQMNVDDVWSMALRCAGAGCRLGLEVAGEPDETLPTGHLLALSVDIMRGFGFEPPPNVEAYAQEFAV